MNIVIHAKPETVEHKLEGNDICECWWTVSGTPRSLVEYEDIVLFECDGRIHAEGEVNLVEYGKITMEPLKKVDYPCPIKPPTRGFRYVR